jgi:mycothione reductase
VLASPGGQILGAHLIGAQAASLIQIFVVAMNFGVPAQELARRPYWIHPALSEVVENALLNLQESPT